MKKIIIGIMVGLIISCTVGVLAASIVPSTIVTYQDKTVNTALDELYDSVNLLKTKGDAEATQILTGKKAIVKGTEITGTMANRGKLNWNPSSSTSYTVPAGYYSGGTLNSSGSYNAGYSVGVAAADNRANPSSVNYQTGYNAGVASKSQLTQAYSKGNDHSSTTKQFIWTVNLTAGVYILTCVGVSDTNNVLPTQPAISLNGSNIGVTEIMSQEIAQQGLEYGNLRTTMRTYKIWTYGTNSLTISITSYNQGSNHNGVSGSYEMTKISNNVF